MMNKKLSSVYYSPQGYWKGFTAISKLSQATHVSDEVSQTWLEKQALWQIYLPPPRSIPRPHYTISKPNEIHQADLLFLPHDIVKRKTYKYALVVVDIASRYKDAEALQTKDSGEVAKAFERIYRRTLSWPKLLQIDRGREFMGKVIAAAEKHNTDFRRGEYHRAQSFVERANRTLAERLFGYQYAQELVEDASKERSREWVKRLPDVLEAMNGEVTRLIGKAPSEAVKEVAVEIPKKSYQRYVGFAEALLPSRVLVRYLYAPGELEWGERRRATDPIWSLEMYNISRSVISKDQPVLYYLETNQVGHDSHPRRGFVREELLVVPDDTELPPQSVL